MGNKINPTGFRLGITQEHRSKWFASSKTYPTLLQEDHKIRTFIQKKYSSAGISDVLIARKADQLELELKTARPGVIVGRQGSGIEELRSGIQKTIGDRTRQVRINVVEVERVDADAYLLAEYIAQQLEKRVAFRRTIRMALQRAQRAGVLGLKVQVGGRLNGAEIARTEGGTVIPFFPNFVYARRKGLEHGPDLAPSWQMDGARASQRWWFS